MEKCISCGKCPISIFSWLWKYNWREWNCSHCGVLLKASLGTYLSFVIFLICACLLGVLAAEFD